MILYKNNNYKFKSKIQTHSRHLLMSSFLLVALLIILVFPIGCQKTTSPENATTSPASQSTTFQTTETAVSESVSQADEAPFDTENVSQTAKAPVDTEAVSQTAKAPVDTEAVSQIAKAPAETVPETETQSSTPADPNGPLVVIDAGHQGPGQDMSGQEPVGPDSSVMKARLATGTYGRTTGLNEYELTLSVSQKLEAELRARGYRTIMTRTSHAISIGNIERAQIANDNQADAMVRIHANGSEDSSINGALTMSPSPDNPYVPSFDECFRLSQNIIDSYCATTGLSNDGVLYMDDMTGINWCQIPVTILEMGFMTNTDDDIYMAEDAHQNLMVQGIADGLDQYFKP